MTPGIHEMPMAAYVADPCPEPSLSASCAAKLVDLSPLHAWSAHPRLGGEDAGAGAAADFGSAIHRLLLEGSDDGIVPLPYDDFRTKEAQRDRDAAHREGLIPMLRPAMQKAQDALPRIHAQIAQHRDLAGFLRDGAPERTIIWQEGAAWCRGRVDWLPDDPAACVFDLKTTSGSADPETVVKRIYTEGYYMQAVHYLRGLTVLRGVAPAGFCFVWAEQNPPYAISTFELPPGDLAEAELRWERALVRWEECLGSGTWPGYRNQTHLAECPGWIATRWAEARDAERWLHRRPPDAARLGVQARALREIGGPVA